MIRIIQAVGLSVAMAVSGIALTAPSANAQGVELRIGPDGVRPIIRDNDRRGPPDRGCSEREARAAARSYGLRDARVVRASRRSVTVEGMTRRGPDRMTFANRRGCPEI